MRSKLIILLSFFLIFLLGGILSAYVSSRPNTPLSMAGEIAENIDKALQDVEEELSEITIAIDTPATLSGEFHPFFIYDQTSLWYWSDNSVVPSLLQVSGSFDVKLIRIGNGAFLVKKKQVDHRFIVSLIMLQRDYIINNDYLNPEWNKNIFHSGNFKIFDPDATSGAPVCLRGNCLFRISFSSNYSLGNQSAKEISIIFFIMALLALLAMVYNQVRRWSHQYAEIGFILLCFALLVIRRVMTSFDFPNAFVRTQLFDPLVFASSSLNASLGDLFLNVIAVLALCLYIFKNFFHLRILRYRNNKSIEWALLILSGLCILFAGLFPFVVIQTLFNNSAIVIDISQSLQFDEIRIMAVLIVLLAGVCSFLFSHAFIRIVAGSRSRMRVLLSFLIAAFIFGAINEISGQAYVSSLFITLFYFSVVYFLKLYRSLKRLSYATFAYLFISIFCLSVNGAYGIQKFSEKEKIENQFRFANNFLIDRDIFGEYLLDVASGKIAKDAFIQMRMTSPFLGKEAIGQKIRQYFLPTYFNKYNVEIFIFNSSGKPIDNDKGLTFSEMVSRYNADAFRTAYDRIYFVNNPASDVTQKYLLVVPMERLSANIGYIVVELSLKKVIPENVYPELLVDYRFQQFYRTHDLSYAVFAGKKILFTSGEFNYDRFFNRSWLGRISLYTKGLSRDGYDHIAQEDQNGRIAVVSTMRTSFANKAANFSFLFVMGLFIILVMIFLQGIYNYFRGSRLFFSAKVQLYLNLAFFIPLIIVCISTLGLTSRSSQHQLDMEYLSKSRTFGQQTSAYLNDYFRRTDEDAVSFNNRLTALANLSDLDANVYRMDGTLLATSQPLIFENHLTSHYINADAFNKLKNGENSFIESEQIGKLKYFIAYTALKSPQTGKLIGVLGIPFFRSAFLLESAQIVVLTNILNIFAFIFIALLTLSYFASAWLTFPLRFITQSLRKTSLTKTNSPLTWNASDEIGLMVREYNAMLYKLGESKNELEQTQREKAWREIAQQVAHEIKNPLTPMKLTLQQLERSLQSGNSSAEKSQKAISNLLAQVDTLNDIASSFSGFAKMPEPVIRRLEVVSTVKRAVDLHSPSGEIVFKASVKEIFVMGDEQMLSRTFSNILLNALQSGNPGQKIHIHVSISKIENTVRLEFRDNGRGIHPEIAERVFLPHFSTKKSGSGLGLAISKQGIEQMGGKIWFETRPEKGTSFFIDLPISV